MDPRRRLRRLPTDVYRAYDTDGRLLYVGVSICTFQRLRQHMYESAWFASAERVRVEQYQDWWTARKVEGYAIDTELPSGNRQQEGRSAGLYRQLESPPVPLERFEFTIAEWVAL